MTSLHWREPQAWSGGRFLMQRRAATLVGMTDGVLTLQELNRATLARQMLLKRAPVPVLEAVGRLAGLQAQVPNLPYIGLWTRLQGFQRNDLTRLMEEREVVRAAMVRSTLHLVTAGDHQRFRQMLQPALARALGAFFGKRAKELDVEKLVEVARPFVEEEPRTTGELRNLLSEVESDADPDAMAYAVRTYLPLVQVPPSGTWGSGSRASYTTAGSWLGESGRREGLHSLLSWYLTAFGPATGMDFQAWSGMRRLKKPAEEFKGELRVFRDEEGKELLGLPDAPLHQPILPLRCGSCRSTTICSSLTPTGDGPSRKSTGRRSSFPRRGSGRRSSLTVSWVGRGRSRRPGERPHL